MKFLTQLSRILIGLIFILSGLIKLNDPTGFSYKLDEYFSVFSADVEAVQDSLILVINDGSEETTISRKLFKGYDNWEVSYNTGNWEAQTLPNPDDEDVVDTTYRNTFYLNLNGNPVYNKEISAIDSNATAGEWKLALKAGQESLWTSAAKVGLGNTLSESETIDVSSKIKEDGWLAKLFQWMKPYALFFAIFVSLAEALIGVALIIGWQARFTAFMLFLISAFFTFLTWYSWKFDKVTDCGCFGDAFPMTPYESLIKNLVMGVFVLIILFGNKYIRPVFSNPFAVKCLTTVTILMVGFSLYCRHTLPVVDFLKFKEGNNVCELMSTPEGERVSPWKITTYNYQDTEGNIVQVVFDSDKNTFEPNIGAGWKYVGVESEEIKEKAYEPPIHDFKLYNAEQSNDYIGDFFTQENKLLAVMYDLDQTNIKSLKKLKAIASKWQADGNEFWAVTSSSPETAEAFRHEHQLNFDFYYGDNTNLKSIIRSNPGLLLFTDTCTVNKVWPSTRLPKYEKIVKRLE